MTNKTRRKSVHDRTLPNALAKGRKKPLEDLLLDGDKFERIVGFFQTGQTAKVVRMMRASTDNVERVAYLLEDKVSDVKCYAAMALLKVDVDEKNHKMAIIVLAAALRGENADMRLNIVEALRNAAEKGIDITSAISELGNAVGDEDVSVRRNAVIALSKAAVNEHTRDKAITELINALKEEYTDGSCFINIGLIGVINADQKTRRQIAKAVITLQGSEWFQTQAHRNTRIYRQLIDAFDRIMLAIRAAEQTEAA